MKNYLRTANAIVLFILIAGCQKESLQKNNNNIESLSVTNASQKISSTPSYRGLYVSNFDTICGNTAKENFLLSWCQSKNINALSLYGLGTILSNTANYLPLAAFIKKAKQQYGIKQIAAVRGNAANVTGQTALYNNSRSDTTERFNYMNLELEWWNNACTFTYYIQQLTAIKQWGDAQSKKVFTEEYIGWFKNPTGQDSSMASDLIKNSHRILVHDYVATPNFGYMQTRLDWIGRAAKALNKTAQVIVIFSAGPAFSYNYFLTHTFDDAYQAIVSGHNASSFAGKNNIKIIGYQIFDSNSAVMVRP